MASNSDKELYLSWLNDEVIKVQDMNLEQIANRIIELEKLQYEAKSRATVAYRKHAELKGKNFDASRDALIENPHFVLDLKDPKEKKESKPKLTKEDKDKKLMQDAGIDIAKLKELIKAKKAGK